MHVFEPAQWCSVFTGPGKESHVCLMIFNDMPKYERCLRHDRVPYLLVPIENCVTRIHPWHPNHVWGPMAGWRAFETTSFSSSTSTSVGSVVLRLCKIMFEIWDHSWCEFGQGSRIFDLKLLENLDHFTPFLPPKHDPTWLLRMMPGWENIDCGECRCMMSVWDQAIWKYIKMLPCHIFGYGDKQWQSCRPWIALAQVQGR